MSQGKRILRRMIESTRPWASLMKRERRGGDTPAAGGSAPLREAPLTLEEHGMRKLPLPDFIFEEDDGTVMLEWVGEGDVILCLCPEEGVYAIGPEPEGEIVYGDEAREVVIRALGGRS